jgi:hypothetical protein
MSVLATALLWRFAHNSSIIRKALGEDDFEVVPALD